MLEGAIQIKRDTPRRGGGGVRQSVTLTFLLFKTLILKDWRQKVMSERAGLGFKRPFLSDFLQFKA